MYRTLVIAKYTFIDVVLQPIYGLLIALAGAMLVIFGFLPFFTLGEDTLMFKSVALDVILLFVLLSTLFATSKSIFEEIEDRTMLTLMSKPVRKLEVMVGKYFGIVLAAFLGMVILGGILVVATYLRVPRDYMLASNSVNDRVQQEVWSYRAMHIAGLFPQLLLTWLEICVLAAVGVALSTRFSLVVNLPTVIIIYLAGNLTRFLFPIADGPLHDKPAFVKGLGWLLSLALPYLQTFDLRELTLMSTLKVGNFARDPQSVALSTLWFYVGVAVLYAIGYAAVALSLGMWSFQTRELGGGEG